MSEPTDFKNREYCMVRVDLTKPFFTQASIDAMKKEGWMPEQTSEWYRFTDPNRASDPDPVFILSYSRPRTTP